MNNRMKSGADWGLARRGSTYVWSKPAVRALRALGVWAMLAWMGAAPGWAQGVPQRVNFQGKLLDTANVPRNGTFSFTFRVCDSLAGSCAGACAVGNPCLWTETQAGISVTNGVFAVQLGAATAIPSGVFSGTDRYLEIQVGAEVGSPRERLVTSPYAFRAGAADDLAAGDADYIQLRSTLQLGATFYVSSGTVSGPLIVGTNLRVGGVLTTGSAAEQITTAAGLVDAAKLSGTLPSAQISGTYSNALSLTSAGNAFTGSGAGLTGVIAAGLVPGDTDYIHVRGTLQAGATFYVSSATVGGPFTATGTVRLGGAAGVNDVTVASHLTVNGNLTAGGAGPHVFTGDVRVNGNNLLDSAGVGRITLGATNLINGNVGVPPGLADLRVSTSVAFGGAANAEQYIAYPFTAGTAILNRDLVIIGAANSVSASVAGNSPAAAGIAVNGAAAGETVWVAVNGIVSNVVASGAIAAGAGICNSGATAGRAQACPLNATGANGKIGLALNGAAAAGDLVTVVLR